MSRPVIVEAVRTPIGKRNGWMSGFHATELLALSQKGVIEKAGLDPKEVEQIVGGCVTKAGEQSFNIARNAWLAAGLPLEVAATTVDSQCGSSQQASTLATGLVGSGLEDLVVTCGIECMSRVPLGANFSSHGRPFAKSYFERYAFKSQFEGAEMIADEYGISREDTDRFGLRSQEQAKKAWDGGHFDREIVPIAAPSSPIAPLGDNAADEISNSNSELVSLGGSTISSDSSSYKRWPATLMMSSVRAMT